MTVTVADLVARAGDVRAVARLISLVERGPRQSRAVAAALVPHAGRAHVVGLTGPPGVGKSTLAAALVAGLRAAGARVAVLAIDPVSPRSGGALLGDRVRMQQHATDPGVFIRSMAARGRLGGLAPAAPQAVRVLDVAGYQAVIVETVGVGQAEVDIAALADATVVVQAPGLGDGVQAAKAGPLEIADALVVNKADRDGAAELVRRLQSVLPRRAGWDVPVIGAVATHGDGITGLVEALSARRRWLHDTGELARRRRARAAAEIEAIVLAELHERLTDPAAAALHAAASRVADGQIDAYTAAARLLNSAATRADPSA